LDEKDAQTGPRPYNVEEANLLQAVINAVPTPIFFKDAEGRYLGCNKAFENYVGLSKQELVGKTVFELFDPKLAEIYHHADLALYESRGEQNYETQVTYADGSIRDVMFHKAVFHAQSEDIDGIVGAILDITERKKAENELEKLALTDTLTGLDNRYSMLRELKHALKRSKRTKTQVAFLMLDLDDFKHVNDTYGHPTGDALLVEAAFRIKYAVRDSDIIARIGGDEFAIVLEGIHDEKTIHQVADKINAAFSTALCVDGHNLKMNVSMGISCSPMDSNVFDELMKMADIALYRAKANGKGCYQFFSQPV